MVTERRDVNACLLCSLKNGAARRCTDFWLYVVLTIVIVADASFLNNSFFYCNNNNPNILALLPSTDVLQSNSTSE